MTKRASRLLMTVAEAADELGVGRSTLYAAIKDGNCELRTVVVGKQLWIPRVAIEEFIGTKTPAGVKAAQDAAEEERRRCPACGKTAAASIILPTCSAAFWSSSVTGSV